MRKGYGPTGVSYTYPKSAFAKKLANGITIQIDGTDIEFQHSSTDKVETDVLYDSIDCACYPDGDDEGHNLKEVHVLILRDKKGFSLPRN